MKQKELSVLLRVIVAVCGLVWLFFVYVFVKGLGCSVLEVYADPSRQAVLVLALTAMTLVILALILPAMVLAWLIFTDIGRGRSFTVKNARRLRTNSHLALAGTLTDIVMGLVRMGFYLRGGAEAYANGRLAGIFAQLLGSVDGEVLLSLLAAAAGAAITIAAAALSHLTLKAAQLQDENDLTI